MAYYLNYVYMAKEQKEKIVDWGDGTQVKVTPPDLTQLAAVICPKPCFPDGERETGKVVTDSGGRKQSKS